MAIFEYMTEAVVTASVAVGGWFIHMFRQKEARLVVVERRTHKLRSRADKHEAVTEVKLGSIKQDLEEMVKIFY